MAPRKKLFVAVMICGLILTAVAYWLYQYQKTYSFAPDRHEQTVLAKKHAECAAYFFVTNRREIHAAGDSIATVTGQGVAMFKSHVQFGLNFSPDKAAFQASIDKAVKSLTDLIVKTKDVDRVKELMTAKEASCYRLIHETADFIAM